MGVGESGKGLPLTSQGGQPQLLDPVHAHLPELWSPRESRACTPPGTPLPDLPWEAGQQPVPRKGLGHPRPTSSSGASGSTPSRQRARGSRRDRSRQVRCCWKADLPPLPCRQDISLLPRSRPLVCQCIPPLSPRHCRLQHHYHHHPLTRSQRVLCARQFA